MANVLSELSNQGDDLASASLHLGERTHSLLTAQSLAATRPRDQVSGAALVVRAEMRSDRLGRPYVSMTLRGGDGGLIEARWWKFPDGAQFPEQGVVHRFDGIVDSFQGANQLSVTDAHGMPDADLTAFAKSTKRCESELVAELEALVATLDADLVAVVWAVLAGDTYIRFRTWPAAQMHHGAMRYGLLAHSLRVATLAEHIAMSYGSVVVPYDRSIAIAAALLHDIGKVRTLPALAGAALPDEAQRLDHVTLSALMVQDALATLDPPLGPARQDALLHAILAHHGRKEWGAPIEPQTIEAWLVHLADLTESRLWHYTDDAAEEGSSSKVVHAERQRTLDR